MGGELAADKVAGGDVGHAEEPQEAACVRALAHSGAAEEHPLHAPLSSTGPVLPRPAQHPTTGRPLAHAPPAPIASMDARLAGVLLAGRPERWWFKP